MATHDDCWTLRDPATTLAEILDRALVMPGQTVIARVAVGSQEVLGTHVLMTPIPYRPPRNETDDEESAHCARADLSDRLRAITEELVPGDPAETWRHVGDGPCGGVDSLLITVVCREGRVVDTDLEWQFAIAWLYANHLYRVFRGDVYVVTPHGWAELGDRRAGLEPTLDVDLPRAPATG